MQYISIETSVFQKAPNPSVRRLYLRSASSSSACVSTGGANSVAPSDTTHRAHSPMVAGSNRARRYHQKTLAAQGFLPIGRSQEIQLYVLHRPSIERAVAHETPSDCWRRHEAVADVRLRAVWSVAALAFWPRRRSARARHGPCVSSGRDHQSPPPLDPGSLARRGMGWNSMSGPRSQLSLHRVREHRSGEGCRRRDHPTRQVVRRLRETVRRSPVRERIGWLHVAERMDL